VTRFVRYAVHRSAEPYHVVAEPLFDCGQEKFLQAAPVYGVLRPAVTRVHAARFGPDQPAAAVVELQGTGGNGVPGQLRSQTELGQLTYGGRLYVEPGSHWRERSTGLEQRDVGKPGGVQAERRAQAADARADDQNPQATYTIIHLGHPAD